MKQFRTKALVFAAGFLYLTASADDGNRIFIKKISQAKPAVEMPQMSYKPTAKSTFLPRTVKHNETDSGLSANFSVQSDDAFVTVWSENFDTNLDRWTINNQVRPDFGVISISLDATTGNKDFSVYDAENVTSLHIDPPFRVSERNTATLTSEDIEIPSNARFHGYVGFVDNEDAGLYISVSTDDFETSTEIWNSLNIKGSWSWKEIDESLAQFEGQTIKLRITFGEGTKSNFGVGGYMYDYYVDGLSITGVSAIDQISVKTGDKIELADLSSGTPVAWEWQFPGGVPETSTERNPTVYYTKAGAYDVTLKVTDESGDTDEITKTAFVSVEAQAPVAGIEFPADFRDFSTRMRLIAPLAPVDYKDASQGYPTAYSWTFYTPYDLARAGQFFVPDTIYQTPDVTVCHNTLDKNYVLHIGQNELGASYQDDSVQVAFASLATNFLPGDSYITNITRDGTTFPGANKMGITAWAERISKPSVPSLLEALLVRFTKASATELMNQIASVGFYLYSSENGLPGRPLEMLDSWTVSELNYAMRANQGLVQLELSRKYLIDDEVFIVIDGIPEKNDSLECAIAVAPLRDSGNTAYMLNKGTWRPFTGYFEAAPGGQTSLAVFPYLTHSVVLPASISTTGAITMGADSVEVPAEGGTVEALVFANRGIQNYLGSDADWCRIVGTPGEYNVDTLHIECDGLPMGLERREATVALTDSVTTLELRIVQNQEAHSDITTSLNGVERNNTAEVFNILGRRIEGDMPKGIYVVRRGDKSYKLMKK